MAVAMRLVRSTFRIAFGALSSGRGVSVQVGKGVSMQRLWFRHGVSWTGSGLAVALALGVGLALGCTHHPGPHPGADPAGSGPTDFPNPLMGVLTKLVTKDIPAEPYLAVKYSLLSNALANLDFKKAGHTTISELSNKQDYVQSTGNQPGYFAKPF